MGDVRAAAAIACDDFVYVRLMQQIDNCFERVVPTDQAQVSTVLQQRKQSPPQRSAMVPAQ